MTSIVGAVHARPTANRVWRAACRVLRRGPCMHGPYILLAVTLHAQVTFTDITQAAGIKFVHNNGKSGKKWLPETLGSGCAFFDADGDGWPDILLINSKAFTGAAKSTHKLY